MNLQPQWEPFFDRLIAGDVEAWNEGRAIIAQRSAEDVRLLKPPNLAGLSIATRILRGANFQSCNLTDAHFESCDLTDADFSAATLTNAMFDNCSMSGACFRGAHGTHSKFYRVDLSGANFESANLLHANFSDSKLVHANLELAMLVGVSLDGADLTGSIIGDGLHIRPVSTKGTVGLPSRSFPPAWFKEDDEQSLVRMISESKRLTMAKLWKEAKLYILESLRLTENRSDRKAEHDELSELLHLVEKYTD